MHNRYEEKDESEIPESLLNEPELLQGLKLYYEAFWELSSDRQVGMAAGPIPHSSIMSYCRDWKMDDEMSDILKILVRKLDDHFLKWQGKQSEKISKSKKKGK